MDAEAPLFLMYTSGTTGKPKGCQHRTGGYLAYVTGTAKYYQDIHPEDVYWCMADIGWITGHSYIVYGPLALAPPAFSMKACRNSPMPGGPGASPSVSTSTSSTLRRPPSACCAKPARDEPKKYNYHFKHMTTVGEPIEPEVWRWYYEVVGKGEAVIVDTWWQTETGGFLCTTKPALDPMKPGSAGPAVPRHLSGHLGRRTETKLSAGSGTTRATSASAIRGRASCRRSGAIRDRFVKQYYKKYCKNPKSKDWRDWPYFAADGAVLPAGRLLPHPRPRR